MKIVTLLENTAADTRLQPQHGLSLYIESGPHKILFDMGQDDTFARNAEVLGVDLGAVDLAVLSHGHYDHGGGLATFLEINRNAPVYLHKRAFGPYYNAAEKYIGLDLSLWNHPRLQLTEGSLQIAEDLLLTDCSGLSWQSQSWGLCKKEDDRFLPDDFAHEQYLQVTENNRKVLISGCSHKGIENIAGYFQPQILVGGFHLNKVESEEAVQAVSRSLLGTPTTYYTGHCTGDRQFQILKAAMGDRLERIATGTVLNL